MRFTVSTKPLKNVIKLGIIKANISNYYHRSTVVQITANRDTLKLNIEASGIKTCMTLKGSGDEDTTAITIVDCLMFKNLIDSIDSDILTIEFIDGGIYIYAGTSKFALSQVLDANDVQLNEPTDIREAQSTVIMHPEDWQFVKDHQLYALADNQDQPIYTNVWVGSNHEVITGDVKVERFTYSKKGSFDSQCLLTPSLINLFTSIPGGSVVSRVGKNYILSIETDSYSLLTDFLPKYESDAGVGSYNADIFLGIMAHPDSCVTLDLTPINKFLKQTSILGNSERARLFTLSIGDGKLTLSNESSSYSVDVVTEDSYSIQFSIDLLRGALASFDSDRIHIAPTRSESYAEDIQDSNPTGCIMWTDELTVVLSAEDGSNV